MSKILSNIKDFYERVYETLRFWFYGDDTCRWVIWYWAVKGKYHDWKKVRARTFQLGDHLFTRQGAQEIISVSDIGLDLAKQSIPPYFCNVYVIGDKMYVKLGLAGIVLLNEMGHQFDLFKKWVAHNSR